LGSSSPLFRSSHLATLAYFTAVQGDGDSAYSLGYDDGVMSVTTDTSKLLIIRKITKALKTNDRYYLDIYYCIHSKILIKYFNNEKIITQCCVQLIH